MCYECQRLTHEKYNCPLVLRRNKVLAVEKQASGCLQKLLSPLKVIKEYDPLFGVLTEDQVGIDLLTRRPRIAEDVLQGIRQYLLRENGDGRVIRDDRVKTSLIEVERDPLYQKSFLWLEPAPIISNDIDKGK